jgi:hypothetical protein
MGPETKNDFADETAAIYWIGLGNRRLVLPRTSCSYLYEHPILHLKVLCMNQKESFRETDGRRSSCLTVSHRVAGITEVQVPLYILLLIKYNRFLGL